MIKTITHLFTAREVAIILANHAIQQRELEPKVGTNLEAELMCVFEKDAAGNVCIGQYRVEAKVEVERESWKG